MKKINAILLTLMLTVSLFAQSPEKMSYQAVIRDRNNQLVTNTSIGMKISILQGSVNGLAVYIETQIPSTNSNGLVTIEIGEGTLVNGNFSTIDWTDGPYFIRTETDPTGGVNYSITGTNQLLSVPYALHAKTAEIITGSVNYTETDPIFTSSEAKNITAIDITNLSNLSGTNTGDQDISGIATNTQAIQDSSAQIRADMPAAADGSETKINSGTGIEVTGTGTTADPYLVNATSGSSYYVGQLIGLNGVDGVVFHVDHTGNHGLICSIEDLNDGNPIQWYNSVNQITGAMSQYNGENNSSKIINTQGTGNYAAYICNQYFTQGTSQGDWYLPSIDELKILYQAKYFINKALQTNSMLSYDVVYWSSTEIDDDASLGLSFHHRDAYNWKKYNLYMVRAIRSF